MPRCYATERGQGRDGHPLIVKLSSLVGGEGEDRAVGEGERRRGEAVTQVALAGKAVGSAISVCGVDGIGVDGSFISIGIGVGIGDGC